MWFVCYLWRELARKIFHNRPVFSRRGSWRLPRPNPTAASWSGRSASGRRSPLLFCSPACRWTARSACKEQTAARCTTGRRSKPTGASSRTWSGAFWTRYHLVWCVLDRVDGQLMLDLHELQLAAQYVRHRYRVDQHDESAYHDHRQKDRVAYAEPDNIHLWVCLWWNLSYAS